MYQKETIGDESSIIEFQTKEELKKYLEEQAFPEDVMHVGDNYMVVDGGWTTIRVDGGIFSYLDPVNYGWNPVDTS
jgi:hypothetical protein